MVPYSTGLVCSRGIQELWHVGDDVAIRRRAHSMDSRQTTRYVHCWDGNGTGRWATNGTVGATRSRPEYVMVI